MWESCVKNFEVTILTALESEGLRRSGELPGVSVMFMAIHWGQSSRAFRNHLVESESLALHGDDSFASTIVSWT